MPQVFLNKALSVLKPTWTRYNELRLGIRTEPDRSDHQRRSPGRPWWRGERSKAARHDDNFDYATIDYWNMRNVVRVLKPGPEDVFYDIGCGMGRILCVMARHPLRKCIGVELSEPLCQIARRNAAKLRGRKAPIEIVCGDATTADLGDGTIYFMFNPFGAESLRDTLENLRNSLLRKPRPVRLVYYNSTFEHEFESVGWLEKIRHFNSFGGHRITLWRSRFFEGGVFNSLGGAR